MHPDVCHKDTLAISVSRAASFTLLADGSHLLLDVAILLFSAPCTIQAVFEVYHALITRKNRMTSRSSPDIRQDGEVQTNKTIQGHVQCPSSEFEFAKEMVHAL